MGISSSRNCSVTEKINRFKNKISLKVLNIRDHHAAKIFENKLIFVRPDQHVVWRGDAMPADANKVMNKVTGH